MTKEAPIVLHGGPFGDITGRRYGEARWLGYTKMEDETVFIDAIFEAVNEAERRLGKRLDDPNLTFNKRINFINETLVLMCQEGWQPE